MKNNLFLFVIVLIAASSLAEKAEQSIAGLKLSYPQAFKSNPTKAKQWMARIPENASVLSLEVFDAPPVNGLVDVYLTITKYDMRIKPSIDDGVTGCVNGFKLIKGMKNVKQSSRSLTISGYEARRTSLTGDLHDGKVGLEQLIIFDRESNTTWVVATVCGKEKGLNPFASLNLDAETKFAVSFLATVSVQR